MKKYFLLVMEDDNVVSVSPIEIPSKPVRKVVKKRKNGRPKKKAG